MPLSMTGFGAAEGPVAGGMLRVEIRTVNHRYFNFSAKLPVDLGVFEGELRDRLRKVIERGHVTVQVCWATAPATAGGRLRVNIDRAREAADRLRELQSAIGQEGEVPLELVARQPEVFSIVDADEASAGWGEIEPIVAFAAGQCREARVREGALLSRELEGRLRLIAEQASVVSVLAPERLLRERDRLRTAVRLLLDGHEADEQRLAQEIAFMAERVDITEELVRLEAHLAACHEALGTEAPVGKQLGFLAQEMGREVNTIGSKANDAPMQHAAVAMKGELERFREQLENLE